MKGRLSLMTIQVKSIESTYGYRQFNRGNVITTNIMKILKEGELLTKDQLAQAFLTIEKSFKFTEKYNVLKAYENGEILLYFAPKDIKLPTAMPFFLTKKGDKIVAVVSVDIYGYRDKDSDYVNIDAKKLYCLMEAAYFGVKYYTRHIELTRRTAVVRDGSAIYSHMLARVLNKKYALNVNKSKYNNVIFLTSKFFMINILGLKDDESTFNYAMSNCSNVNPLLIRNFNDTIPEGTFKDITTLIDFMASKESELHFHDLTTRGFIEQYIIMYDASALFALEYLPYFIYNVLAVNMKAFINNQNILEDIIDKSGPRIYVDLSRIN